MNTLIRIMKRMRSEVEMLEHLKEEVFQANLEMSVHLTKRRAILSSNQAA